jgi:hypothetical protein
MMHVAGREIRGEVRYRKLELGVVLERSGTAFTLAARLALARVEQVGY